MMRRLCFVTFLSVGLLWGCGNSTEVDQSPETPVADEPGDPATEVTPGPATEMASGAAPSECVGCEVREQFGNRVCRKRETAEPEDGITTWLICDPGCCEL